MARASFLDEAVIEVVGGSGGAGSASFMRTKRQPRGGPDGGNGGSGGNVHAKASLRVHSLQDLVGRRRHRASAGAAGMSRKRHGAAGEDLTLRVPVGTDITDEDTGALHASLLSDGDGCLLAAGGGGGRGNVTFKSSTNRAPQQHEPGREGDRRNFRLTLRLLADVGLLGLPNAGKSTLLNALTRAKSRTGDHPFATLRPQLGVVELADFSQLVIADMPGLIEGAAEGVGLGTRFLMHATRTNVLLHLVDASCADVAGIIARRAMIDKELAAVADAQLEAKPRPLVLTKVDLLAAGEAARLVATLKGRLDSELVFAVSALSGSGTADLVAAIAPLARAKSLDHVA